MAQKPPALSSSRYASGSIEGRLGQFREVLSQKVHLKIFKPCAARKPDNSKSVLVNVVFRRFSSELKERRGYCHLKEEALDRTMWRHRFGGGFGPVVRQNTE